MSAVDFFQYLLDDERSEQLGNDLMVIYSARVEHQPQAAAC